MTKTILDLLNDNSSQSENFVSSLHIVAISEQCHAVVSPNDNLTPHSSKVSNSIEFMTYKFVSQSPFDINPLTFAVFSTIS